MNIDFSIPAPSALVIAGPQGCGKTTLARQIAEKEGIFSVCEATDLLSPFGLGRVLRDDPAVLIIEAPLVKIESLLFDKLRTLIVGQGRQIQVDILGKESRAATMPKIIICTCRAEPFLYSRWVTCLVLPGAQ